MFEVEGFLLNCNINADTIIVKNSKIRDIINIQKTFNANISFIFNDYYNIEISIVIKFVYRVCTSVYFLYIIYDIRIYIYIYSYNTIISFNLF